MVPIQYKRSAPSYTSGGGWWAQLRKTVQQAAQSVAKYASRNAPTQQQRVQYGQNLQRYYQGQNQGGSRQTRLTNPYPQVAKYQQGTSMGQTAEQARQRAQAEKDRLAAQKSTQGNWMQSFKANYPEFSNPTKTTMPDTYQGQMLRYSQQRNNQYGSEFRLMPDTYIGQGNREYEQKFGLPDATQDSTWDTGAGGSGGYGGGGYYGGGYGGGGYGGGGSYEPPKPEWWLNMLQWNINRPEGG